MTRKIATWSVVIVLVLAGIAFLLLSCKTFNRARKPPFNPTKNACVLAAAGCPKVNKVGADGDVDTNGCPNGGYDGAKQVCTVTFAYYQKFGGCNSPHEPPMTFYSKPGEGQASTYHLVADPVGTTIRAYFTEIACDTHKEIGSPGLAQPFVGDDFLTPKPDHTGSADASNKGKCYKVTVDDVCTIDPHISIGN